MVEHKGKVVVVVVGYGGKARGLGGSAVAGKGRAEQGRRLYQVIVVKDNDTQCGIYAGCCSRLCVRIIPIVDQIRQFVIQNERQQQGNLRDHGNWSAMFWMVVVAAGL